MNIKITKPVKLLIFIIATALAWYWFDWRMVIIIGLFTIDTGEK